MRRIQIVNGENDEERLNGILKLAKKPARSGARRVVCVEVKSQQLLGKLQTEEMCDGVEVHPYTFEGLWAERMFVSLPRRRVVASPLDWEPITYDSERRVNMVVFGVNAMTEALVRQACLVCHYPNYIRDISRRTCITVVDAGLREDDNVFLGRFGWLLRYCRWSFEDSEGRVSEHVPDCGYLGGEFVDVEFRFVAAEEGSELVRGMLKELAKSERELPTIVFAGEECEKNWDLAVNLPIEYFVEDCRIPVYVRMKDVAMFGGMAKQLRYRNIKAFGMDDCEFDLSLPLTRLGKGMACLYDCCYNNMPCEKMDECKVDEVWKRTSALNRFSNEVNAMTIMTKLRSVGKDEDAPLTDEDVALLSEVEHNRWSVEKLIAGVRPVTEDEQRSIDADRGLKKRYKELGAHYDLRPYSALKEDGTGKNVQAYDDVLVRGMQAVVRDFRKRDKGAKLVTVERDKGEKMPSKAKQVAKWTGISVFALFVLSVLAQVVVHLSIGSMAECCVAEYVYQLRVDSIEVRMGDGSIDTVLYRGKNTNNVVGTAFSLDGVGIVTARHCVEYWLYDSLRKLSYPAIWEDEMRAAVDVETYNDTTKGGMKRMVAVCTLLRNNGDVYANNVVFDVVDRSRDIVMPIGMEGKKWRYVIPVFDADRDMMKSDVAICRRENEKGIVLYDDLLKGTCVGCYVGFPREEGDELISGSSKIKINKFGIVRIGENVSPGFSGSPVVILNGGRFKVVGVMSRNDIKGAKCAWATPIKTE